jgi:hypothetical protein
LLDLAIEEMEWVGKSAGRSEGARKGEHTSWGELTEKGVKNFVSAEKSLIELVVKPAKTKAVASERKRKVPRARPRSARPDVEQSAVA